MTNIKQVSMYNYYVNNFDTPDVHFDYSSISHKSCRIYKSKKGANTDIWIHQWWDQVSRSSKYPYKHGPLGIPEVGSGV
jgi:hypothetical protein